MTKNSAPLAAAVSDDPLTYDIPKAGALAGLSRNASYGAAARGEMPTIKLGWRKVVPAKAWLKILNGDFMIADSPPLRPALVDAAAPPIRRGRGRPRRPQAEEVGSGTGALAVDAGEPP
jgi:hypothetical protein